jgi:hypothetical protein
MCVWQGYLVEDLSTIEGVVLLLWVVLNLISLGIISFSVAQIDAQNIR